ncbi:MAG: GNAT family N-acetyltransferase [Bauldia sp.]
MSTVNAPPPTIPLSLDGYTELPPGKIANVVTFLERTDPSATAAAAAPGLSLIHVERPDAAMFRDLYNRIGRDWLWFSRAVMSDDALARLLSQPWVTVLTLQRGGKAVGLVELDSSARDVVEIVSFGVVPEEIGSGAAHVQMGKHPRLHLRWRRTPRLAAYVQLRPSGRRALLSPPRLSRIQVRDRGFR